MKLSTWTNMDSNTRATTTETLNATLADALDLALLTKQAHWNIRGPLFIAIHEMLDKFRIELDDHIDTIAERIVQLGGTALGTTQVVAATSRLSAYPTEIHQEDDHLTALIARYGALANSVREAVSIVGEAGDANSADILTGFSRAMDKSLWMLDAHLSGKR